MMKAGHSILLQEEKVQRAVRRLAAQISEDYASKEVFLACVLKGAFIFTADLMRELTIPARVDFITVSSYGAATETSGVVRLQADLSLPVQDRHVLLIEDIVDTGLTAKYLLNMMQARKPASLRLCTLLDKPSRRETPIVPDYVGITIPNRFVYGYGLDVDQLERGHRSILAAD